MREVYILRYCGRYDGDEAIIAVFSNQIACDKAVKFLKKLGIVDYKIDIQDVLED